jgi:single-stranded DNA-specific DHH superfamily exonuclease
MRLYEIRKLLPNKERVSKLSLTESEKIFGSYTTDRGLITRMYREFRKLNSQNINDPLNKWAKELNRTFSKKEAEMVKKHMKKCSKSFIKNANQNHFKITPHSIRMATIKNTKTTANVDEGVGKKEPSYTADGNVN